ncbi:MAG: LON peptidase substrate-binding domain-containing protein [Chloroflexota bacterium]
MLSRVDTGEARALSDQERTIPLFPLNTVLFPGMSLPLHIFEERYREMIRRCLSGDGEFGVALIREGPEVGGPAEPFEVGTIARITEVDRLPDGRMNLMTLGVRRFRLLQVVEQHPYLVGRVVPLGRSAETAEEGLVERVQTAFRDFVRAARSDKVDPDALSLAPDTEDLSYQVAASLPAPRDARQRLLELDSPNERLAVLLGMLRRERDTARLFSRAPSGKNAGPFSLN